MNRSFLSARFLSHRLSGSGRGIRRAKFHSQGSNHYRHSSSAFWISAAGTCIFFQAYENITRSTLTEGRENGDDKNTEEKTPWYRRYTTLNLEERMRPHSTTRKSSYSGSDSESTKREDKDNKALFYGQCPKRQIYQPPAPYPAWDFNWDGKVLDDFSTLEVLSTAEGLKQSGTTGTTRHILLVRHGQYEEKHFDDRKRCLTALGRRQAHLTGKRIAALVENIGVDKINAIYTSDMLRAKQTAWIIAKSLPDSIPIKQPDPDLNEGLPAQIVPPRPDLPGITEEVDANTERMDRTFARYFYRADPPSELKKVLQQVAAAAVAPAPPDYAISTSGTVWMGQASATDQNTKTYQTPVKLPRPNHKFDIIVCHGNVIRYFACRALQIPPEAWLRLSVFNCSITYLMIKPNGYVSCRMIGDIGHLGYKETTFSGAHGLVWS